MSEENNWQQHFSPAVLNSEDEKILHTYSRETLVNAEPSMHSISNLHTYDGDESEIQNSLSNLATQNGFANSNDSLRDRLQTSITSTPNQYEIVNVIGKGTSTKWYFLHRAIR